MPGVRKYNFVYETTNKVTGKKYIGVRCTDSLTDGYIGNGIKSNYIPKRSRNAPFSKAVLKYGYQNFERKILKFFNTYSEALKFEGEIVTLAIVKSHLYYNVALGGVKSPTTIVGHSKEARLKMSHSRKGYIKGELNLKAILNDEIVLQIRHLYISKHYPPKRLANYFNVSRSTIRDIAANRTWVISDERLLAKLKEAREYYNTTAYDFRKKTV